MAEPENDPSSTEANCWTRQIVSIRHLATWALFVVALWMVLRPALLTTVTADDFVNPFAQAAGAGFSPKGIWTYTVQNVTNSGHFNYLGQLIGSLLVSVWAWFITSAGVHFTTVLAVTKFCILLITIELCTHTVERLNLALEITATRWRSRLLLLVTFGLLLQVHVPWSNDPVTSYPMAGYGSVALGLGLILMADHAAEQGLSARPVIGVSALAIVNVLYYELNVAAVGAAMLILGWKSLTTRQPRERLKLGLRSTAAFAPSLTVAAALVVASRPSSANYTGTSLGLESEFVPQAMAGLISSLPGSSWHVAGAWLDQPINTGPDVTRFLLIAGFSTAGVLSLQRRVSQPAASDNRNVRRAITLVFALIAYWVGATVIQAATTKVQDEAQGIGYVYTFYAVGSAVVAIVLAVVLHVLVRKIPQVGRLAVLGIVLIGAYQFSLNSTVTMRFNEIMIPAQNLLNVYSEGRDEVQRCQALAWWKSMGWPEYYSMLTEDGMNASYEHYRGEPFCRLESTE